MKEKKHRLSLPVEEFLNRDLIFFNNPVLIQGLALTPVVAACNTLANALALSVAAVILVVPSRLIGDALCGRMPGWLRPPLYAFLAAALYLPAYLAVTSLFQSPALSLLLYLPLLTVDTLVLSRSEIPVREGALLALRNGLFTCIGFAIVACTVGAVREFLSRGALFGVKLLAAPPSRFAGTVGGGLILTALLAALFQSVNAAYRTAHAQPEEVEQDG